MTRRYVDTLTAGEFDVLVRVADGDTISLIAADTRRSYDTVKSHMDRVRLKLGAHTAAHAVALAYHRGILLIPGPAR